MSEKELCIGLDIAGDSVMISCFAREDHAPKTLATVAGSEQYRIPLALYKKRGIGQWRIGSEAAAQEDQIVIAHLWQRAAADETVCVEGEEYRAFDLLTVFFRKVLLLPQHYYGRSKTECIGVAMEELTAENTALLQEVFKKAGFSGEQFFVLDYRESFYYYALSQKEELFVHDAALFTFLDGRLQYCHLTRDAHTSPQVVTLTDTDCGPPEGDRDLWFAACAKQVFAGKIISAVYLVGDAFTGDWMKQSVRVLCAGRRVFSGKNLYAKGACYAACMRAFKRPWPYIYLGEHALKYNVSIKVRDGEGTTFYPLLTAGANCFETKKECEVILDDAAKIDFYLQYPQSSEAAVKTLALTDLPERERKTTRLCIALIPKTDRRIAVTIRDLGFGEIVKSSGKIWTYDLEM